MYSTIDVFLFLGLGLMFGSLITLLILQLILEYLMGDDD